MEKENILYLECHTKRFRQIVSDVGLPVSSQYGDYPGTEQPGDNQGHDKNHLDNHKFPKVVEWILKKEHNECDAECDGGYVIQHPAMFPYQKNTQQCQTQRYTECRSRIHPLA